MDDGGWPVGSLEWLRYQAERIANYYRVDEREAAACVYNVIMAYNDRNKNR